MRAMTLGSATALLFTLMGVVGLQAMRMPPHLPEAMAAMAVGIIASVLAGVPLMLADRSAMAMMQAGLLATVLHMVALIGAAGIYLFGHPPLGFAFIYWLAAIYAVTLVAVVAGAIQGVRAVTPRQGKA
jgi:hypothetical protein